jgi:hypothetical protein
MQQPCAYRTVWPTLRGSCLVALAVLCLASSGCVRRRMTIRSHPPGAQVFVDDREIGTTPCSTSYIYYGKRNVMLVKDGYKTERLVHQFTVPWWEYVPLDFYNENLNPYEIRDERTINVTLQPEENMPPETLLERANNMRGGARLGLVTPLPDVKPGAVLPKMGVPGQGLPGGEPIPYQSLPAPTVPNIPFVPSSGALGPPASIIPPAAGPPPGSGLAPNPPTFGPPPIGAPPAPAPGGAPPSGVVPPPGPPAFFPNRAF